MNKKAWEFLLLIVSSSLLLLDSRQLIGENQETPRGECACRAGNACWHYLQLPATPYDEPCGCPCCTERDNCKDYPLPKDWDSTCMETKSLEAYLKRHRASWQLQCSECYEPTTPSDFPYKNWPNYPFIKGTDQPDNNNAQFKLDLERETKILGHHASIIISKHFYLVTDIPSLTVQVIKNQPPRKIFTHEIMHLYIQRAEQAYHDFVDVFGEDLRLAGPIGIFLVNSDTTQSKVSSTYFGNAQANMLYGSSNMIPGRGFASIGFVGSKDKNSNDDGLHFFVRHEIGHLLMATLKGFDTKYLPMWLWTGAAHWLSRLAPTRFGKLAVVCTNEGGIEAIPGVMWKGIMQKEILAGKNIPFSEIILIDVIEKVSSTAHRQNWSYFVFMIKYYREQFAKIAHAIKLGSNTREAFKKHLGCSTTDVDKAWAAYIMDEKKIPSLLIENKDPTALLKSIDEEVNYFSQASMIRDLEKAKDIPTAKLLVKLLAQESDQVRESAVLVLAKSDDPKVRQWLREEGLSKGADLSTALVAKVLGLFKDPAAVEPLLKALDNNFWFTRANAAFALSLIGDARAINPIMQKVSDKEPKVIIAATDALATWKKQAEPAVPAIVQNLEHEIWQVRVSAADALGEIGSKDAIDPILKRIDKEAGRLREDGVRALKKITGMNYELDINRWKNWWKQNKDHFSGPATVKPPPINDPTYTQVLVPQYYGINIYSKYIIYVMDISKSMEDFLHIQKGSYGKRKKLVSAPKKNDGYANPPEPKDDTGYVAETKLGVAKEEMMASISELEKGTCFNIIFFSDHAKLWKPEMFKITDEYGQASACNVIKSRSGFGLTNYHEVFKLLFGIDKNDTYDSKFLSLADTVFILTDGRPTEGEITRSDELLAFFNDRNRFAKMKVHVIALGKSDIDQEFLRSLAEQNQGTYVHLGEDGK
jgi:HEAT repeat protein